MSVVSVLAGFEDIDVADRTWLSLGERLLQAIDAIAVTADDWATLAPASVLLDVQAALLASAGSVVGDAAVLSAFVDDGVAARLSEFAAREIAALAQLRPEFAEAVVGHAVAEAISAAAGPTFVEWFRSRISLVVAPGAAYPVGVHDPRGWLGGRSANTRPGRIPTRELAATSRLRLGDALAARFGLRLDFDRFHHLSPIAASEPLRLAAVQPAMSLAEFEIESDPEAHTVRNHGPRDAAAARELVVECVRAAAAEGAQVVVVPEYCLDEVGRERLLGALERMDPRPVLVVAGSTEVNAEGGPVPFNEAWLAAAGGPGVGLYKAFPAIVEHEAEGVASGSELWVFWSQSATIAVLICRDAASPELIEVLGRAGVNLLLVPAFSDRTGTLVANACTLRTRSQAVVVVANAPAVWSYEGVDGRPGGPADRAEAAFDAPYEHPPSPVVAPDDAPGVPVGAGAWLFDVSKRALEWVGAQ